MDAAYLNTTPVSTSVVRPGRTETTILLVYFLLVVILGVPGNCLILRVYWGKTNKSSTNVLIMGLALSDLIVCLTRPYDIAWYSAPLTSADVPNIYSRFDCWNNTIIGTSILITAVIAVDRYDCICRPNRRIMTYARARKALFAALSASVAANTPLYVHTYLGADAPPPLIVVMNALQIMVFATALVTILVFYRNVYLTIRKHVQIGAAPARSAQQGRTALASLAIATVSAMMFMHMNGLSALPTSNIDIKLFRVQTRLSNNRETAQSSDMPRSSRGVANDEANISENRQKRALTRPFRLLPPHIGRRQATPTLQRRTTAMLFITSVVFLLSWLPYWIFSLCNIFGVNSDLLLYLLNLLYLNHAVNPFIYGLANKRFRKDCRDVFRKLGRC
ncbi:thyrotropin-releasing hormone receptor-like [Patiria miniata]|uniref:G-protein coupled receptors family 1 profile domain-containing protein n=1 Tax=Patiria miniata TaxID=46514 RepID=A0A913ZR90_PATMI|nr:thyrotropin-releasing hormone receptor-like [Patiria miniata]